MTNKQTIDGVSRELLEIYTGRKEGDWVEAGHELRALLDKPVETTGDDVLRWMDEHAAAQPQGEVERLRAQLAERDALLRDLNMIRAGQPGHGDFSREQRTWADLEMHILNSAEPKP